jgi:Icc-related predicted phosphoesterase
MTMAGCPCLFVSDLHGSVDRYRKLVDVIRRELPRIVFLGGDLLPFERNWSRGDFTSDFLAPEFEALATELGDDAPRVMLIFGNDDPRSHEAAIVEAQERGIWEYLHMRSVEFGEFTMFGYGCVPPTPFLLKDWERYDVSRYADPGCVSPEEGVRTVPVPDEGTRHRTIQGDLETLTKGRDLARSVLLFHTPPYRSRLDRAALDDRVVDHAPLDVHVGSIAVQRLIEQRQPLLTLHGHIHESTRLTGSWRDRFGRTHSFSAAHDGPELALVRFDLDDLDAATRELL